uniref:PDZ domain-containing protein n=1 Tax=Oryza barthii TaxID=65489 RepID=A0A0D3G366_9ORYZ
MAGVAALFASPAFPFPSTSSVSSCSCRFRPAVARAPRHQPPGRRVTRRFDEVEGVSKRRRGIGGGGGGGSQASSSSSRKDRGLAVDFKESQVSDFEDLEEDKFLNAVVKVYCTHIAPDYGLPWQKQRQHASTGRQVLARGIECDLALLSVENEEFWRGTEPLQLGRLPCLQDSVTVVGYPLGGDTISVTKGVVSRIEIIKLTLFCFGIAQVTPYAHGTSDLLGIQIDAAINPGNSGGPAFNDHGECIGVAFQVFRSDEAENIGYVIPTTVVSHFLNDYQKNGKYTGFPCLGVLLQKLENPALRESLKVPSSEGVLVRRVEPTAPASKVLRKGDVITSFDGVAVGCEGTVPFRSTERIAFRYLTSQKYAGDVAQLGIIRAGNTMKVQTVLQPRKHLVPFHVEGGQPSYLIVAGLVFTPLTEPFIEEECEETLGVRSTCLQLKLLAKARYSLSTFEGEQIVIVSQVIKLNGTVVKNIHHLAHLVDNCKDKFLTFEFEDDFLVVLDREEATTASSDILKEHAIPSVRSSDLSEPYVDTEQEIQKPNDDFGDSPVTNYEMGVDCLLWA